MGLGELTEEQLYGAERLKSKQMGLENNIFFFIIIK